MKKSPTRAFIDFYSQHSIIPTRQDISDFKKHLERRSALYRTLGVIPSLVKGRSVLELGPGTGENALHTATLNPELYVLVDANPPSLKSTAASMKRYDGKVNYKIVDCEIEKFSCKNKFDLVLCEGVIPTQVNPAGFLRKIAAHAKPGGITVITCMDSVSLLSEMLRRYMASLAIEQGLKFEEKVVRLTKFFQSDLKTLKNMSRRHQDWVIDNIIHPWTGDLFSMAQAIETMDGKAFPIGSSPQFLTDWRWYKDIHGKSYLDNSSALDAYLKNVHNFIDYRAVAAPASEKDNRELIALAHHIYTRIFANERGKDYSAKAIAIDVKSVARLVKKSLPEAAQAFKEFADLIKTISPKKHPKFAHFSALWGRGQQYISFELIS